MLKFFRAIKKWIYLSIFCFAIIYGSPLYAGQYGGQYTSAPQLFTGLTQTYHVGTGGLIQTETVTAGDIMLVCARVYTSWSANPTYQWGLVQRSGGTAQMKYFDGPSQNESFLFALPQSGASAFEGTGCAVGYVTQSGSLPISVGMTSSGGTLSNQTTRLTYGFLKKQ